MDNALEISPLLYLDADGSLSLGPEAEVEDQGDTIVISRGRVLPGENFPHQFYAGPDARLVRSPDGKCWAQVPILRRLAALPRGEKLSIDDFDATEGAPIPGLVPPGGRAAMVGGRAGDFHFGSSPTP